MSISDEAVEAAAKAFYGTALDDVSAEDMEYALEGARLALEAAAPYMLNGLAASLGDATAEVLKLRAQVRRESGDVQTMADVLVSHQRQNASSCLCGWARLGHSHAEHQAKALSDAGFGSVTL